MIQLAVLGSHGSTSYNSLGWWWHACGARDVYDIAVNPSQPFDVFERAGFVVVPFDDGGNLKGMMVEEGFLWG